MNYKFLNKVCEQILSETRVNNDKIYMPFFSSSLRFSSSPPYLLFFSFSNHCKEVYSLNKEEIEYVWNKYKKEVTTLINDKELIH